MAATTKPDKRKQRKAKIKKWRDLNPKKGFSPDLLTDTWQSIVDEAANIERKIIQLATSEAVKKVTARAPFVRKLKQTVAYGIGRLTNKAKQLEKDTVELAQVATRAQLKQVENMAPRAPRNPELGNTVRIPKSLTQSVQDMAPSLYGSGSVLYDDIVRAIAASPPESDVARRRIAQKVIDGYRDRGITGFVDKAGRRWNMVSYVEMATRTATSNLAREAYIREMLKVGLDVVRVTVMPNCHPFCRPYQGRLLSITGETTGTYNGEKIVASLSEALEHGYNHVGCRHTLTPALPGVDHVDPDMIDPGSYADSQKLRGLEREVRKWKRAEVAAVTPEGQKVARAKIMEAQKQIRDHVGNTGIPRNRLREQINRAL